MNQEVTDFIEKIAQSWQVEVSIKLRDAIHQGAPDVEEVIQWGKPHYKVGRKYLCTFTPAKEWVNFTLLVTAGVSGLDDFFDPEDTPVRITIKIRERQEVDYNQLATLIKQATAAL
jgi:hypothetical protein